MQKSTEAAEGTAVLFRLTRSNHKADNVLLRRMYEGFNVKTTRSYNATLENLLLGWSNSTNSNASSA